jgi:copper chaperone
MMSRYVLDVRDMSCMHCVNRIDKALTEMGLSDFEVDLEARTVTVETEDISTVQEKLDDVGYPAEIKEA